MVKKIGFLAVIVAMAGLISTAKIAKADNSSGNLDIPQKNGTFDVPGHPKLKVHVFVHYPKARIAPQPNPLPQCRIDDIDSNAVVSSAGWALPSGFTYNLNPTSAPSTIGKDKMIKLSVNAFNTWSANSGNNFKFIRGNETLTAAPSLGDGNIVAWGRTPQSALGVTYIFMQNNSVAGMDTILNQKIAWSWSDPSSWNTPSNTTCAFLKTYDAQNILTHELGHWMGLDDEYDTSFYGNSTMYGYGSTSETKKDTLTTGDISGLKTIYP